MSDDEENLSKNAAEKQNNEMDIGNVNLEETEQQAQEREEQERIEREAQEIFQQEQVALLKEAEKEKHRKAVQERVQQMRDMRSQGGIGSRPHIQPSPSQQTPSRGVSGNFRLTPHNLPALNYNRDPVSSSGGKDIDEFGTTRVDSGINIYLISFRVLGGPPHVIFANSNFWV
jgi:hypothetical protein